MQPNACTVRKVKDDMIRKGGNGEDAPPRSQERLPPEILDIIKPALQVGGLSGMLHSSILSLELQSIRFAPLTRYSRDQEL